VAHRGDRPVAVTSTLTRQYFDGVPTISISAAVNGVRSDRSKKTSKCGRRYQPVDILGFIFFALLTVNV
jgi:hypothetical protein